MKSRLVTAGVVSLALVLAIALALLSVLVQRTGPELAVTGNPCGASGSELCYAPALKGGFPLAFLFDRPGISVPDALFLEDEWRPAALLIDIAVYFAALPAAFRCRPIPVVIARAADSAEAPQGARSRSLIHCLRYLRHHMPSALLIIDVQSALCSGQWACFDIAAVIDRINAVTAKARAASAPVIFIQHEEDEGPLQFDTAGWQLDARLDARPDDPRIRKTACDSFHRTDLQALLQSHGIDHLIVCGLQSEFCVDSTVRGALAHGYPVTLVADAHSTLDNGVLSAAQITAHHNATLANVGSFGPQVTTIAAAELRIEA